MPPGINQECPQSASYRQEVRDGQSRVEQYRLQGWQPLTLLKDLKRAGYVLTEDETSGPNHYSVFLGRSVPAEVFYTAVQQDGQTLVTLSGP